MHNIMLPFAMLQVTFRSFRAHPTFLDVPIQLHNEFGITSVCCVLYIQLPFWEDFAIP